MKRFMGRCAGLAAVALVCGAMGGSAWGGQYHVYSCRTPDGQVAPVDGWSETVSQANDHTADTCASGGGLVAALDAGHSHAADTDLATWAFNAPAGETLAAATVWRAGDTAGGGNSNDSYFFWLTGVANSGENTVLFDKCNAFKGCSSEGTSQNPLAANNRVEVPEKALHSPYLLLNASCGSLIAESECSSSPGDENGNAAVVELFAADLTLNDEAPPTVEEVKGPLAEASTVSGTTDIAFTAGDGASGVYEAIFQIDGATAQKTLLDANGGKCHDAGQTTDGLPAFLYTRPCPASASVDVPFDTTALQDGPHHVVVSVTDAAGNATPAMDRQVTVANHSQSPGGGGQQGAGTGTGSQSGAGAGGGAGGPGGPGGSSPSTQPGAQPQERGAPNGRGASDEATLTARWKGAGVRVRSAYGRPHTIEGSLSAAGGAPIVGASIDVAELPAAAGAQARGLPSAHTDAKGRFTLRLPRTLSSATVSVGYRSHAADTTPVATRTLTLAVKPTVQLREKPGGEREGPHDPLHGPRSRRRDPPRRQADRDGGLHREGRLDPVRGGAHRRPRQLPRLLPLPPPGPRPLHLPRREPLRSRLPLPVRLLQRRGGVGGMRG